MTSWNGNIFRVTGHLCWEFTGHRWIPRTKASDTELWCFFFIWRGWWFETPPHPLWHLCNAYCNVGSPFMPLATMKQLSRWVCHFFAYMAWYVQHTPNTLSPFLLQSWLHHVVGGWIRGYQHRCQWQNAEVCPEREMESSERTCIRQMG